jgi:hypothetical protein
MGGVQQVQPQVVVDLLKEDGIIITPEEGKLILQFMYMLANIALDVMEEV